MSRIGAISRNSYLLFALYFLLAAAAAVQAVTLTRRTQAGGGETVTKYNNYVIFRCSHEHLVEGRNLYCAWPGEHWDLFKYSPTFALLFGFFSMFPDWLGLAFWNLLNALLFFLAVQALPVPDSRRKIFLLLLAAADAMTSLQNSQSNLLVAALILLGFGFFEKGKPVAATLCLVATFYIKLFGFAAIILLLLYPGKLKSILYTAGWLVLLWMMPLPWTGFGGLIAQYRNYLDMLRSDHAASVGLSVMGWLQQWFGVHVSQVPAAVTAFALLCLPLLRRGRFGTHGSRVLLLCAIMVWMVIFNHKAESPTFVIATSAVWLWFLTRKRIPVTMVVAGLVFVFTSLAATDLWPKFIRTGFFEPWGIKAVPCILAWLIMVYELLHPPHPDRVGDPDRVEDPVRVGKY